jgi:AAA ATPase domain
VPESVYRSSFGAGIVPIRTNYAIAMSQSQLPNPFIVGLPIPPERFVGREPEIREAFDQIYNHGHLAIWGGSGMGKTSFLQKLESAQAWNEHGLDASTAVIIRFSCESFTPFTPSNFWGEALSLLKDKLENEQALQSEIEQFIQNCEKTQESLRKVLARLKQRQKYLVLLVDDYDAALHTNDSYTEADMQRFLSECRSLAVNCLEGQNLSVIVTSLKRLNELGPKLNDRASPWYNHYLFLRLKPFNNTEIDQFLKILRVPELREANREITGGHPGLLQIAGFQLYRDLQNAAAPSVKDFANDFSIRTQQIFNNIWDRCSQEEQTLLMLMALSSLKGKLHNQRQFDVSGIDLIFSQKERELTKLEEQGVIVSATSKEKTIYTFTSSIMERWVIQELWQTDEHWLQARQKVFMNLMSHQQKDKFTNAIKWLWNNKDTVPSTIEWFGKLASAFPNGFISPIS